MATKILREEQRCRSLNIYLLLLLFIGLTSYSLINAAQNSLVEGMTIFLLSGLLLTLIAVTWFIYYRVKMEIKVNEKGLKVRHFPMHPKSLRIKWDEVEDYEFIAESPAAQWSGWGVHFSSFGEQYYSLCGNTGLRLHTKDGNHIFIGSRKLHAIKEKIETLLDRKS